jgi:hypothetical protein
VSTKPFLAGLATGLAIALVATLAHGSFAGARVASLEDSVLVARTQRRAAVALADSGREAAETATLALQLATARWDQEREALRSAGRRAGSEAARLRGQIAAIAPPDLQILVDSLNAASAAELGAERALRVSAEEEAASAWTAHGAERRLRLRVDDALDAALAEIRARETLEAGLRRQLRPTFWSLAIGDFAWTAAAVAAGWACSEMTRGRGDLALIGCAGGAAVAIAVAR